MTEIEEKVKCNFCGGKRTNKGGFVGKDKKQQRYYICQVLDGKNLVNQLRRP